MDEKIEIPSIKKIKDLEYQRLGKKYKPFFDESRPTKTEPEVKLKKETEKMIEYLPSTAREEVISFANDVAGYIPENIFSEPDNRPINSEGLKALVALSYTVDEEAQLDSQKREHYIRALSALSADTLCFSNNYSSNTQDVIWSFSGDRFSREGFYNFLIQLNSQTMPITGFTQESREERLFKYNVFLKKMRSRYASTMDVFLKYCEEFSPDRVDKVKSWKENLVYVDTISRLSIFSNDPILASENKYNVLSAGAVAFGIDPISGLPLTVTKLPYNYDDVSSGLYLHPKDDPTFKDTLTLVHENIHNVKSEKNFTGDYFSLINELLTDSSAWIITLQAEGQDFADLPEEYRTITGYYDLTFVARSLINNGLFNKEELVELAMHQDPQDFLRTLDERVQNCEDDQRIEDVINTFLKRLLIRPRKSEEIADLVEQFKVSPSIFMQNEITEMWEQVGSQYLGNKWYVLTIFEWYRSRHSEVGEEDYSAIRNKNGTLNDEAVGMFHELWEQKKEYKKLFLNKNKFIQKFNESDEEVKMENLNIPERLIISDDDEIGLNRLLYATNAILSAGLDYHCYDWDDTKKYRAIVESSKNLYQGVIKILEKNWSDKKVDFKREDVFNILDHVVPGWLPTEEECEKPEEVVEKVLQGMEAITQSIDTEDGLSVFGLDQVLYWGPALEIK
jgi:hypothetical protein